MIISVVKSFLPTATKAIGKKGVIELVGAASLGAGVVNFALDKATDAVKGALDKNLEAQKQALLEKKAEKLQQKADEAAAMIKTEETEKEEPVVELGPKKASNNKKNK